MIRLPQTRVWIKLWNGYPNRIPNFYFIYAEGIKVGAIRIVDKKTEEPKIISPIFIQPKYRNRGYATSAVKEAERMHGEFGWELDTIAQEKETRRFYENLG